MIWSILKTAQQYSRRLRRSPVFAIAAIVTIGVAIGCSTSVFSVLHAALFYHFPFLQPERLISIDNEEQLNTMSRSTFYESSRSLATLDSVAEYHTGGANLVNETLAQRLSVAEVSATFCRVLGIAPVMGRDFLPDEDTPGRDSVVLISYRLWQKGFHGDVAIVGRSINLNGLVFRVIGVLPANMDFPMQADLWAPTIFDSNTYLREGTSVQISAVARLAAHSSLNLAQAELNNVIRHNVQGYEGPAQGALPRVETFESRLTGAIHPVVLMLNLAIIFMLLIMCANVAHLVLVHTTASIGEIGVRCALGAGRWSLFRQQLIESLILALVGGVLGIGFALYFTPVLYRYSPSTLAHFSTSRLAWPIVGYAFLTIIVTGVLAAVAPAWFAIRQAPSVVLRLSNSQQSSQAGWLYNKLVVSEISLALILLLGTGIFLRGLSDLNHGLFSYNTGGLLTFSLSPHGEKYVDFKGHTVSVTAINDLYGQIISRLEVLPDVVSAAAVSQLSVDKGSADILPLSLDGRSIHSISGQEYIISTGYFETLGIRVLDGRIPSQSELLGNRLVVLSEDFARQLWGRDTTVAVGRHIFLPLHGPFPFTVAAVVSNSYRIQPKTIISPELYVFLRQLYCPSATFVLRTSRDPLLLLPFVRREIAAVDQSQPIFDELTMEQRIAEYEVTQRFALLILADFAGIAVFLAIGGLYVAMSMNLQSRLHEIGIRMALGAARGRVLRMILVDGCKLAIPGIVIGVIGAFLFGRIASSMVFGSSNIRLADMCYVVVSFFLVIMLAGYLAAREAARVEPSVLLRME